MNTDTPKTEALEGVRELPELPTPARRSGQQMAADGDDKAFFDCYDPVQMREYGERCAAAAAPRSAAPETGAMYKALMESRLAFMALPYQSGATIKALALVDGILNAAPVPAELLSAAPCPAQTELSVGQIGDIWIRRKSIHGGDLMPQLYDFARAVVAADRALRPTAPCSAQKQNAARYRWAFAESPSWTYAVCKWHEETKEWLPINTSADEAEMDAAILAASPPATPSEGGKQ